MPGRAAAQARSGAGAVTPRIWQALTPGAAGALSRQWNGEAGAQGAVMPPGTGLGP
jgi:hypothetical protein